MAATALLGLGGVALAFLSVELAGGSELSADAGAGAVAAVVEDFTLPSARDASLIRLSDYGGKVVLINWWRTSCQWSNQEAPRLVELYEKYRDQGLVILGISDDTGDTVRNVPEYLEKHGITWPVGLNDQGEFTRGIRPMGSGETPENYIVSRSGEIAYLGLDRQPADWTKVEEAVARLVAEGEPAESPIPRRELEPAPAFSLPDLSGGTVLSSDFAGMPLVVHFFTSGSCDWTGKLMADLNREYAGRLQVVGINLFDEDAAIRECAERHGADYPMLRGDETVQRAWIGSNEGWATFFVTADGRVLKRILNSIDNGIEGAVFRKYAEILIVPGQG